VRILVDLKTHVAGPGDPLLTQVEKVPPLGPAGATAINGKYSLPGIPGADWRVTSTDYVLNGGLVDGGSVVSKNYAHLLASFPQFGHIYFNPLLTADNVAELDLTAFWKDNSGYPTLPPVYYPTRAQTGRPTGPPDAGQMPTSTAVLGANATVTPPRPGVLVTQSIDIAPFTAGVGADEFMVYWYLYGFNTSEDVSAHDGAFAGMNEPAIRRIEEVDQEPAGFSAYISTDGGVNWCEAGLLEPVALAAKATEFQVAFVNTSPNKIYLATFAVLF